MDYKRFLSLLPALYDNWGQDSVCPKSKQFQQILERVEGMTTASVMQLLNFAVDCMEPDEIYCQIGCFDGANLIGALLKHPNQMAYAVDNFSDFDPAGEGFNKLIDNLSAFGLEEQVFVCNQDWEEFLFELKTVETENKIGLYFFNAAIDYRAQILALLLVRPYLAEQALIIIGNSNRSAVKQAAWDFMAAHPQAQTLLDWTTPEYIQCTFWNDIQILSWDSERNFNYEFFEIKNQRNELLIKSISNCSIELEETKKALEKLREEAIDLDKSGSYELAENKYKELLKWDKNQEDVLFYLGMLYYKTNQYQQALDLLFRSLELEPSKAIVHYNLGLVLEKIGNITQAI